MDESTGQIVQTAVMAHVSASTDRFYISRQAMRELGIIPPNLPQVQATSLNAVSSDNREVHPVDA